MNPIKLSALFFTGVMLAACGGGSPVGTSDTTDGQSTPTDNGDVSVGVDTDPTLIIGSGVANTFSNGSLTFSATELGAGSTITVSANVVNADDANRLYVQENVRVQFSSLCASQTPPKAEFAPAEITAAGTFETTYEVLGCTGSDVITASVVEEDGSELKTVALATGTVTIAPPISDAIQFTEAAPGVIALDGLSNQQRPSVSQVVFTVTDETGSPIAGKEVCFFITSFDGSGAPDCFSSTYTEPQAGIGGMILTSISSLTDTSGQAKVRLKAGVVSTSARVVAVTQVTDELGNVTGEINTTSDAIVMNTGMPDQDSFSLSIETQNPRGWDIDGSNVAITARASDSFNNPVLDGTRILFTTEGGDIVGECPTVDGACSVNWESQDPRPADGVVTILARAVGVSSFTDLNGNATFDIDLDSDGILDENSDGFVDDIEPFEAMGEAFLDADNDGFYDAGEPFNDLNGNFKYDPVGESFTDSNGDSSWTAGEAFVDANGDGVYSPEVREAFSDLNKNGVWDAEESYTDTDSDGRYDYAESFYDRWDDKLSSGTVGVEDAGERNGVWDAAEPFTDVDGDGVYDPAEAFTDTTGDGLWTQAEPFDDLDGDGVRDAAEPFIDANGNSVYDAGEPFVDADGNGALTPAEAFVDTNGNGKYDFGESFTDSNGNSLWDNEENYTDENGNGSWDAPEAYTDSDGNGVYNYAESFEDQWRDDGDGILEPGELNGTWDDHEPFVDANNNDKWDAAEPFTDTNDTGKYEGAEPFSDDDGDGKRDEREPFVDANGNGIWDSQEPFNDVNGDGQYQGLISAAESYTDSNNNGVYDAPEAYTDSDRDGVYDAPETYTDSDSDGKYDAPEVFYDFNKNEVMDDKPQTVNSARFYGRACSPLASDNNFTVDGVSYQHCQRQVEVRDSVRLTMSDGSRVFISRSTPSINVSGEATATVQFTITDVNGNAPPEGTGVSFEIDNGTIVSGDEPSQIPDIFSTSGYTYSVSVKGDDTASTGNISIEVTSLSGRVDSERITVVD